MRFSPSISGFSPKEKERSFADELAIEDILNKAGAASGIDSSDFETVESYTEGGLDVSSCSGATNEIKNDIEKLLSPRFAALGAEVKVEDVYLTLEMNGELTVSSVLSVSFKINMDGKVYEITMRTYTDYDYTDALDKHHNGYLGRTCICRRSPPFILYEREAKRQK